MAQVGLSAGLVSGAYNNPQTPYMWAMAGNSVNGDGGTPAIVTATAPPSPYALQLLAVMGSRGSSTTPTAPASITGCGLTWTLLRTMPVVATGTNRSAGWLYHAMSASPTEGELTITSSYALPSGYSITYDWVEITGVRRTGVNGSGAIQSSVGTDGVTSSGSFSEEFTSYSSARGRPALFILGNHETTVINQVAGMETVSNSRSIGATHQTRVTSLFDYDNADTSVGASFAASYTHSRVAVQINAL